MNIETIRDVTVCFQGSKVKHDAGTECCLSLCQAVSFLPAAEEDEEMMMRKEDGHRRGRLTHHTHRRAFIIVSWTSVSSS